MKRKTARQKSNEEIAIAYQQALYEAARRHGVEPDEALKFAQQATRDQRILATNIEIEKRKKNASPRP